MEKLYEGKTKDVLSDGINCYLKFKDDITGTDGVQDTGGNEVAGSIEGMGEKNLKVSRYFFEELRKKHIPTHYLGVEEDLMKVKQAETFGKGIEVITRFVATGSFIRRYGRYAEEGMDLNGYTEITLKDDLRNDPLITKEALELLGILKTHEYDEVIGLNTEIASHVKEILEGMGLKLYDIKFEYGRIDGELALIDEISAGNMRAYSDGKKLDPEELSDIILKNI